MKIFDSHAHYDDEAFQEDRKELLDSMQEHDVALIVNVGASIESSKRTIALTEEYPFIYGAVGVHPEECGKLAEADMEWLKEQSKLPKIVAVGEIGLDYYWDEPARDIQAKWFDRQLELAKEVKLPVIIHSRDAAKDTLDMMKAAGAKTELDGVIHCYSYSKELAHEYLDMGFYFGIGGVVTFSNAKKVKEAVEYIPLQSILLETDCPYLAPNPHRGKRNSSLYIQYIAKEIAAIKGIEYEEVLETTFENAKRMFRMAENDTE